MNQNWKYSANVVYRHDESAGARAALPASSGAGKDKRARLPALLSCVELIHWLGNGLFLRYLFRGFDGPTFRFAARGFQIRLDFGNYVGVVFGDVHSFARIRFEIVKLKRPGGSEANGFPIARPHSLL